ncbi:hypothetical protein Gotri_012566 [Gossypium trilobum]|uniref:Uncharacterized protein n=1 Tax=Gossypium trilobum TaxID=34281 RepID=A0A7J9DQN2_9ROSI|nr:hypothetical protein [Gossypium trilobum]
MILNLIIKAGFELAADVVSKIQNRIKYIKKLGICRKIFYDMTDKSFHLNVTKNLHYWGQWIKIIKYWHFLMRSGEMLLFFANY